MRVYSSMHAYNTRHLAQEPFRGARALASIGYAGYPVQDDWGYHDSDTGNRMSNEEVDAYFANVTGPGTTPASDPSTSSFDWGGLKDLIVSIGGAALTAYQAQQLATQAAAAGAAAGGTAAQQQAAAKAYAKAQAEAAARAAGYVPGPVPMDKSTLILGAVGLGLVAVLLLKRR